MNQQLKIDQIKISDDIQSRVEINESVVNEYVDQMQSGVEFPAITVFYDGSTYWLSDGFHRITAAIIACIPEITCDIKEGTKRDAILYSVGANASHGLRRTNADKRKAVLILLNDEEWRGWSNVKIANMCRVDEKTVRKYRDEVTSEIPKLENDQPTERTYTTKHGTTAVMNTSNIGRSPYAKPIDITKESKAPPIVPEPTVYHWEQPESEPIDPEVITFEDEDIVLQHEYLPLDVTPGKLMPIIDNLYNACEEKMVHHWEPGDLLKLCSRLELLQSKIQTLIIMIKQ